MSRIISVVGRKGGVAKTTSTVHLATHFASLGFKTCIIDYDTSQSNSTRSLIGPYWEAEKGAKGICSVINDGGSLDEIIRETPRENLYLIPSEKIDSKGKDYNIEGALNQMELEGYTLLKELIEESEKLEDMHFIFIDNAPSLGITTLSSLIASDYFLVPVVLEDLSIEAIADTIKAGLKIKKIQNKYLEPLGFFVSKMDKRPKMAKIAMEELRVLGEETGLHFFETYIPVSSKFNFLPREQKTIFDVTTKSTRGHKEYILLAEEILERIREIEEGEVKKSPKSHRAEV